MGPPVSDQEDIHRRCRVGACRGWLSMQPLPLGYEARRGVDGGGHGRQRHHGHLPLHAGVAPAVAQNSRHGGAASHGRAGVPGAGAEVQRVRGVHRRRVAPPRELPGDEQVLQQGAGVHDSGQQPPLLRQRPLAGEHVEHGVGRRACEGLPGGRKRGRAGLAALVGGGDGVEEGVDGGGHEAAVGVGDAGGDERRRRGGEEEVLQLLARVVALLGHLADEVGELGDALLLLLELLLGNLQLQRRRHQALLQLRHALLHQSCKQKIVNFPLIFCARFKNSILVEKFAVSELKWMEFSDSGGNNLVHVQWMACRETQGDDVGQDMTA
uniref:Uncharacterized protein n=1 Tax=Arundo donax TaxID=35708 RepID=A0A0A9CVJ6_ARUDO